MKLPSIENDFWDIQYPSIDPNDKELMINREKLIRGDAVKLSFKLIPNERHMDIHLFMESMWLVITEKFKDDLFIGILTNSPVHTQRSKTDYLKKGAEIPFHKDYVLDIQLAPSPEEAEAYISTQPVTAVWPRH